MGWLERAVGAAVVTCALFAPARVAACGGFFCNAMAVDQAGEQVVFAYEADGTVTTVVQIRYSGPSEDFAWIVPVTEIPEVTLGTAALFTELDRTTRPTLALFGQREGRCRDAECDCAPGTICLDGGAHAPPPVEVERFGELGPYEIAVLSADDPRALVDWLTARDFRVDTSAHDLLAEYVTTGHRFVALRLRSSASVGDLQPIVLRSATREPCIPLRLTAIAATPDMPVTVFVLADRRARPLSWLLVEVDLMDLGVWRGSVPYVDRVTATVDSAGGHAFVTDFAGPVPPAARVALDVTSATLAAQRSYAAMLSALGPGSLDPVAQRIIRRHQLGGRFQPSVVAAELEAAVLRPRREAQQMLDEHVWLTRLSTTLSPEEMTDDPTFTLSDELPPLHPSQLTATLVSECSEAYDVDDAPTRLELGNGMVVRVSEGRLLRESSCPWAPRPTGCRAAPGTSSPWALGLLALWLTQRRARLCASRQSAVVGRLRGTMRRG